MERRRGGNIENKPIKGIYIHIPFCSLKCPYCDFLSITNTDQNLHKKYINFLIKELRLYKNKFQFNIETIYFGGGTPSLISSNLIEKVIRFIKENFTCIQNLEITLEANPNTLSLEEIKILKEAGVNRISIGNQSFNRKTLQKLGRDHNQKQTVKLIDNCIKAEITNINLDLIYGVEDQNLKDLKKDLNRYTNLPITHISAYMLTAYNDTPLGSMVLDGKYKLPGEEETIEMFYLINETLEKKGFYRYELSNWAKKGYECKHNIFYWVDEYYLGVGVSASSYIKDFRFTNTKNLSAYFEKLSNNELPVEYKEKLTKKDKNFEKVMLGLRTIWGVELDLVNLSKAKILVDNGFGYIKDNRLILNIKGLSVINEIVLQLT
ncbi:MAG TPA: radical SAM family heme chaperone HemW [Hydrogenothermaceae bacterium]|nr:radical SAM family heme chaperone HemW [Hydrogenothermaceae bacterium]